MHAHRTIQVAESHVPLGQVPGIHTLQTKQTNTKLIKDKYHISLGDRHKSNQSDSHYTNKLIATEL